MGKEVEAAEPKVVLGVVAAAVDQEHRLGTTRLHGIAHAGPQGLGIDAAVAVLLAVEPVSLHHGDRVALGLVQPDQPHPGRCS